MRDACAAEDADAFNEAPQSTKACGEDGYEDLPDADAGITQVKTVDATPAKEDAEQTCR